MANNLSVSALLETKPNWRRRYLMTDRPCLNGDGADPCSVLEVACRNIQEPPVTEGQRDRQIVERWIRWRDDWRTMQDMAGAGLVTHCVATCCWSSCGTLTGQNTHWLPSNDYNLTSFQLICITILHHYYYRHNDNNNITQRIYGFFKLNIQLSIIFFWTCKWTFISRSKWFSKFCVNSNSWL